MKNLITLTLILLASIALRAQTFNGEGGPIPIDQTPVFYSINVETLGTAKLDTAFGLVKVGINITHTDDIAIEAMLISPDGTQVILTSGNGYSGDNYTNTYFDDRAKISVAAGVAPFNGTFRPNEMLGTMNNGQIANGIWKLLVRANWPINFQGTLLNWSLTFGSDATSPESSLTSSNLPIVIINTNGQLIPNDPKIAAGLKIINNGPGKRNNISDPPQFEGSSGIETRGSTAQFNAKKSYGVETWDSSGNDIDTLLLSMPSESDWILNAGFTDKTFIRNALAYQVWQNMGYYAPRYQLVELVINGLYKGVYTFSEKIKRNKNRVDIAKLKADDNAGDSLTGGYIIKIDKKNGSGGSGWTSPYLPSSHIYNQTTFFQYEYPDDKAITPEQKTYIQKYITEFETALNGTNFADTLIGFRKYIVESTFIDYFIENEISKNIDGFRCSMFMHKQRDDKGGKLRMGPIWDFDLAWHNYKSCGGDLYTGWAYQFPCENDDPQVPFWWSKFLTDTLFTSHLKCRWQLLRQNILSNSWFDHYIDSLALKLDESQQRNYAAWQVLGVALWSNPTPIPTTYQGEISSLKDWIHNRLAWLDKNMPGKCTATGINDATDSNNTINIYPNPATNKISIAMLGNLKGETTIRISNMNGKMLQQHQFKSRDLIVIDVSTLDKGVFLLQVQTNSRVETKKIVIQ